MLRTAALWGTFVLASRDLRSGQSLEVGETPTALIAKPDDSPVSGLPIRAVGAGWELDARGATGGRLHLRGRTEDPAELAKSGAPVPIVAGDYGVLQYGTLSVFFQFAHPAPVPSGRFRPDLSLILSFVFALITVGGSLALLYLLFPQQELAKPLELTSPEELQTQYHFTPPPPEPSGGSESEGAQGTKTKQPQRAAGDHKKAPGPKTAQREDRPGRPGGSERLSAMTEVMKSDVGKEVMETLGTISSVSEALGGLQSAGLVLGGRSGGMGLHASGDGGGSGGSAVFGSGTLDTGFGSGAGTAGNGRGRFGKGSGSGNGTGSGDGNGRGGERHLQTAVASAPGQGLNPEQIGRVVRARNGAFRACYESAAARDPKLQGGVTVSFTVSPDGSVAARIASSSLDNARVESCMLRTFSRLHFPSADKPTNATFPFIFRPGKD
ncbi:MAG: AgmX/PglI C-terminal domain-containing protein [Deltaproteobacteria bacterium]